MILLILTTIIFASKKSLAERNINIFPIDEIIRQSEIYSYIVVVELISTNERLITTCKKLIDSYKKPVPNNVCVALQRI